MNSNEMFGLKKAATHPPTHIVDVCSLPPSALDDHDDRWLKSKI